MPVQPITRQTYRQAARVLARAFLDEPVSQRIYCRLTPPQILKNLALDFTGELAVCLRRGEPLELHQNGAIAAAAVIYPPGAYPLPWSAELVITLTSILGHTRYDRRAWQTWLDAVEQFHPHLPHYYLEYLGVEPAFQGQGLGSQLLSELTRRADALGVGCYLETATPRNLPLYRRFGFEITAQKDIIDLPAWFLYRPANKASHLVSLPPN